jgi:replicative DNA helicase
MAAYGNGNGNGNGHSNGNGHGPSAGRGTGTPPPTDKLPPQNLEAEQGVLGSILLDNDVLHEVVPLLKIEDFYRDSHQLIYRAVRDLYDLGRAIDAITLAEELTRRGEYEKIGGDDAVATILGSVPHAANAVYYAQIVRKKAITRELIEAAHQIIREGYSNARTAEELLEMSERLVFTIAEDQVAGETVELRDVVTKAMDRIALRSEERHPLTGVPTGFFELDDITGGFQPSQLVILAARPSMGKTAFALNICEHVAFERKTGVLLVSLEMGSMELGERLLCARSKVDGHKLRTGHGLGTREMTQLGKAYDELRSAPVFIDDTPARNMLQITANARRLKMRQNIGLIVVDYIQLIDAEESRDSRQEQIAKISRRLKTLARELNVPVIALSQLNRAVENREDRRPRMADLRESGAIEQDADLVLLLHRPEYYDPNDQPGIAELIVAKNRSGPTGNAKFTFLKNITRFENTALVNDPIDAAPF